MEEVPTIPPFLLQVYEVGLTPFVSIRLKFMGWPGQITGALLTTILFEICKVIVLLIAGLPVTQGAFEVISHVSALP